MIRIEKHVTFGWEGALRGMRNPLGSWAKSDSTFNAYEDELHGWVTFYDPDIGDNDHELAAKLAAAGTEHRKFLRMIHVQMDVVAPLYWWKEFDTYKVGTTSNSCSTMHTIHKRPFELDDFSHEHLDWSGECVLKSLIKHLNACRDNYQETNSKDEWWQLIQLLPSSYNQQRTIDLNYEVLANIYRQRKGHRLDEWEEFRKMVKSLPCSELITGGEDE